MATSGVHAWSLTARDIVTAALEDNAIIALGTVPTDTEMSKCLVRLNGLLKSLQIYLPAPYRERTITATVDAGDPVVVLPEGVRDVVASRVVMSPTNHRNMTKWERSDYLLLPNKVAVGSPNVFTVDRQAAGPVMTVWPVPSVDTDLVLDVELGIETVTAPEQTVDVPEDWQEAVFLNLAKRCAGMFGVQLAPEASERADGLLMMIRDYSRPESYYTGAEGYFG